MEEIKIGDYIRTIKGNICKVLGIRKKHKFTTSSGHPSVSPERYFVDGNKQYSISKPYVKKYSKNIIDLIEVGDYVNGYYVEKVWEQVNYRMAINLRGSYLGLSDDKFIKSIVTHEQFAQIEYKVEE